MRPSHRPAAALCLAVALAAGGCALVSTPKGDGGGTLAGGGTGGGTTGAATTGGTTGGTTPPPSSTGAIDPNAPTVTAALAGRFVAGDGGQQFGWSGATMSAHFTGTGINITLNELEAPSNPNGNYYDVAVDGNAPQTLITNSGANSVSLVSNLPSGAHTVQVRRRTEGQIGATSFGGFSVVGGSLTPYRAALARRMLIIGDSISCGYGVEGTSATCTFSTATENVSKTYGVLAATTLGADVDVVAWSGRGVYRNNDNTTAGTLPLVYPQALATDPNTPWPAAQYVPQVVVINLGTNDFYQGVPPQSAFTAAYTAFVKTLRGQFPSAHIFVGLGPMLSDNYPAGQNALTNARTYLTAMIAALGDANVSLIEFPVLQDGQMGCDSHPNAAAHAAMATQLVAAINQVAPW